MAFELLINGVDYTNAFIRDSLSIDESLQAGGQTMAVRLQHDAAFSVAQAGQHIVFKQDGVIEFAGRIGSIDTIQPLLLVNRQYDLPCVDYTKDLDSKLLQETFDEQSAGDMIRAIVGRVGRGFTSNNVVDGPLVPTLEADLEPASSLITRIAEAIEHQWYVDYNRDINFFYVRDRPHPTIASIDLDTNIVDYSNIVFSENWEAVKNVIYLTGAKVKSTVVDQIVVAGLNGDQRFFPLNYEPSAELTDMTVAVNGVSQALFFDSIDGIAGDGQGSGGMAYVCIDNWGVRFPDDFPPGTDDDLADVGITYKYMYEPVIVVSDEASIAAMKARENATGAPSDGIHELKFNVPDLRVDTEDAIYDYGQLLLARYANPVTTIQFESWTQGWRIGQSLQITSTTRSFDETMYVTQVNKRILKSSNGVARMKFVVSASTSPFPG